MRHDDHRQQARPRHRQRRPPDVHADQYGQDGQVEREHAAQGAPLAAGRGAQQRGRELLAPHHDRVGHRAEQHQVQREPAGASNPAAACHRDPTGEQVGQHEGGR
jgi:hypothetical protein